MLSKEDVIEKLEIPLLGSLTVEERVMISINKGDVFARLCKNSVIEERIRGEQGVSGLFHEFMIR